MVMEICMPHTDNGSYVLYIHPHWNESWEGKIKITDEQISNIVMVSLQNQIGVFG